MEWYEKFKDKNFKTRKFVFVVSAAAKCEPLKLLPPEPDNTTDVEDCIKKAKANDKEFKRININNIKEINADVLKDLLNALKENTIVEILEMANVGMTDSVGRVGLIFS